MKVYVDKDSCIRAVGTTTDTSLTELSINDEINPFKGWSVAKICCFKVMVSENGRVTMMTPYIDSRLIEHIDRLGAAQNAVADIEQALCDLSEEIGG